MALPQVLIDADEKLKEKGLTRYYWRKFCINAREDVLVWLEKLPKLTRGKD